MQMSAQLEVSSNLIIWIHNQNGFSRYCLSSASASFPLDSSLAALRDDAEGEELTWLIFIMFLPRGGGNFS